MCEGIPSAPPSFMQQHLHFIEGSPDLSVLFPSFICFLIVDTPPKPKFLRIGSFLISSEPSVNVLFFLQKRLSLRSSHCLFLVSRLIFSHSSNCSSRFDISLIHSMHLSAVVAVSISLLLPFPKNSSSLLLISSFDMPPLLIPANKALAFCFLTVISSLFRLVSLLFFSKLRASLTTLITFSITFMYSANKVILISSS